MNLVNALNLYHSFGDRPLLDNTSLSIESGERICLVGRNGTGKTTLLKMIAGQLIPDDGTITRSKDIRVAALEQEVAEEMQGSVYDCIATGIGTLSNILADWHRLTIEAAGDPSLLPRLHNLQDTIEANNAWNLENRISTTISTLELSSDTPFNELSGGMKRRVLLGQALVSDPDLLLLDEPTNHLDIDSILWLENFLRQFRGSLLFITHDRSFLRALATRIIDLDRGSLTSWPGSYDKYLQAKQAQLDSENTSNALFDRKLALEEAWIRKGIKARRTRNEGRVRALKKLRRERIQRREVAGRVKLVRQQMELSGKFVFTAENISFEWPGKPILNSFSCKLLRGEKIGIIGPNACGKSTLIKLLLGKLKPQQGRVTLGTKLEIAYFDQHRETIDPEKSVRDNIADGTDTVMINGRSKHVISYLKDFLFIQNKINLPAKALSGGERNRLLLARLFTRSFNVLIMDEPTNDLDMDTLELLEEQLVEFNGTLLLISHDRSFIDNLVTSTLVFEGQGQVNEYIGGYDDWIRQRPRESGPHGPAPSPPKTAPHPKQSRSNEVVRKELKALPGKIEKLEVKISGLQLQLAEPGFYQQDQHRIGVTQDRLKSLEDSLKDLYQRWESLEAR